MQASDVKKYRFSGPILLLVTALFWMSYYTYPSFLTPYLKSLEASSTMAGLVVGSYGFTQMVLRFPLGILSSKTGHMKYYVLTGLVASGISSLGLALSENVWLILLFRGLAGVAASFWVQLSSLYLSYYSAKDSTAAVSRISSTQSIGIIVASFVGSRLIYGSGMKAAFLLGAATALVGFVLGLFVQDVGKPALPARVEPSQAGGQKWFSGHLLLVSSLAAVSQMINFATVQGFVPQYAEDMGADAAWLGFLTTAIHLSRAVAILLSGQIFLRWFKSRHQLLLTALLNAVLVLLLPLVRNLPLLMVHQIVSSACVGIQMSLLMDQATRRLSPEKKSPAMGFYQAVYGIGMVAGPALMGWFSDLVDLWAGFLAIGFVGLSGFFFMYRYLGTGSTPQEE